MEGVSWWSWQHAGRGQWRAVRAKVASLAGYEPDDGYPTLRSGSQGDLVAWAQQHLAGGDYLSKVSGYYTPSTRSAVLALQTDRGLARTGSVDPATWRELLKLAPLAVRWTKKGAVAASGGGGSVTLPEPRSAALPAARYEVPPGPGR
jgi:peptidoglycan hydrolase-like protein with peptidoglycan-binding domain